MSVYGGGGYQSGSTMGGAAYAQPPRVRFEAMSDAWRILTQNLGLWIVTTLVYAIISVAISLIVSLVLSLLGLTAPTPSRPGDTPQLTPAAGVGFAISYAANLVLSAFFTGGLYRMAVRQVRGEPTGLGDLFSAGDVIGPLVIAALLTGLGTIVGSMLCVIPGILVAILWVLTNPIIVDQRVGGVDAMRMSWNAIKTDLGMAFLLLLVLGLIQILGAIPCGLGLLITFPLMLLSIAVVYNDFFPGGGGAPAYVPGITMPPPPAAAYYPPTSPQSGQSNPAPAAGQVPPSAPPSSTDTPPGSMPPLQ